ncbi:CDP-glycerol glycerophosphotransferase family protein [Listeria grayi]|uniref:CDP-glycerol glycerophosphotransferase family protein n=1 Tax=Listeria grayi TaxID=1641 RepID=UPI000313E5DA|nr:CDP-glycerol glycerophosphotransferase family protein [Listeria grayi]
MRRLKARATTFFINGFMRIFDLLPKRKRVIFESFFGKQYSDSPKVIYEYLKKHKLFKEKQLIWVVKSGFEKEFEDLDLICVRRNSLKWLFYLATSSYWVNNIRMPNWVYKSNRTTYLQTWHGTPIKKLGLDIEHVTMPGTNTAKYHRNFVEATSKWDYMIAQNDYAAKIFEEAFHLEQEKILTMGYPRNEELTKVDEQENQRIKERLHLPQDKKIILFAPTWRDNQNYKRGEYIGEILFDLEKMYEALHKDYILLIKWHYLISDKMVIPEKYQHFAFKPPQHININELFKISDVLVTDYSSVMFDFANLDRKILFHIPDYEEYKSDTRGLYFDLTKTFPLSTSFRTKDLIRNILNEENESAAFFEQLCYLDKRHPTEKIVNKVFYHR